MTLVMNLRKIVIFFSNTSNAQQISKRKTLKFNDRNKDDHIAMFCFIKKSNESKQIHPHSYFYKENCDIKNRNMHAHCMYSTNTKGPKNIWVQKVEKSNYDAEMTPEIALQATQVKK